MKKKLSTTTLADQAEEQIIAFIKENSLVPGSVLPNEMQFSEMLGISRNVVREAMSRLRMLGLIQSRTKRGMVVTEPPLLNGFKKVLEPNLLSIKTIKNMMGMRIALETGIAEFLFKNITDEDIQELEQIVLRHQAIGIDHLSVEDEMNFHNKIYEIIDNDFILEFSQLMYPVVVFCRMNYDNYFGPINERLVREGKIVNHSDLFNIIKNRDKKGYQKAIQNHLKPYWEFISNFN